MPIMEQNKKVLSGFWRNILRFLCSFDFFVNSDSRGNVTDCAQVLSSFICLKTFSASIATVVQVEAQGI